MPIVVYAVGSTVAVDVEETCARLGLQIAAGVKNYDGPTYLSSAVPVYTVEAIPASFKSIEIIVPLFTPADRKAAAEEARQRGFERNATLVDPTAVVAASTRLGKGTYINAGAIIGAMGRIGDFAFINRGANIGHHVDMDEYVSIGPGANIAGRIKLGRGAVVATGAVILPELEIGANAVVAAGAIVTKSVPPHSLVMGNPARVKKEIIGYKNLSV